MTDAAFKTLIDSVASVVRDYVALEVRPLAKRLKELEARPMLKYAGTWEEGVLYPAGRLVTRSGALWLSTDTTNRTPGAEASGWRLIVKKGDA